MERNQAEKEKTVPVKFYQTPIKHKSKTAHKRKAEKKARKIMHRGVK